MLKKLFLLLCLVVFVAVADAAPKKAAKKATSKKKAKQTEVVANSKKKSKKPEPVVEAPKEENDDEGFLSVPDEVESENGEEYRAQLGSNEENGEFSNAQIDERLSRKKFEDEQRLDEYANSLRRRDWLKDRLMLQVGMGSRMPFMGESGMGMGFGAGVEYISRWHAAVFGTFGFLPNGEDNEYPDIELEGGFGYKFGFNYYLFPKNPLHIGVSVSYGTVYFDHNIHPDKDNVRPIIIADGWQFDALITYLTSEWYYLQFSIGAYYAPKMKHKDLSNPSFGKTSKSDGTPVSVVINPDGMSSTGVVFGITIGYAFPEFFPDDTEKRRREREKDRKTSSDL